LRLRFAEERFAEERIAEERVAEEIIAEEIIDPDPMSRAAVGMPGTLPCAPVTMPLISNRALALGECYQASRIPGPSEVDPEPRYAAARDDSRPAHPTARILEFPRSWMPPSPALDELAEPVSSGPRILEVPEFAPPPPALGGITIDPAPRPALERRAGIDLPLPAAPLGRRLAAAAFDALLIALSCAIFAAIFWKITIWNATAGNIAAGNIAALRPPRPQIAGVLSALAILFWSAYQYLFLVYSASTPGLRLAGLRLLRFDGRPLGRNLRRWRVLASFLSALSLAMGYLWVFLDEDALCWHDRITHTYLELKT
jgi:uncharacterized RDD family membrane protein YckC